LNPFFFCDLGEKSVNNQPIQKFKKSKPNVFVDQFSNDFEDYEDRNILAMKNPKSHLKKSISSRLKKWFEGFKIPNSIKVS